MKTWIYDRADPPSFDGRMRGESEETERGSCGDVLLD